MTFDLGSDTENSGYVRVYREGALVLGGFIRQGVRLTVKLAPGDYTVYYTTGPEWFGSTHLMGRDAVFGSFPLTVAGEESSHRAHGGRGGRRARYAPDPGGIQPGTGGCNPRRSPGIP